MIAPIPQRPIASEIDARVGESLDPGPVAEGDHAPGFLRILRRGLGVTARAARLREGDVLVGLNGAPFSEGLSALGARFDALEDEDAPQPQLLTFWREGVFFHQLHAIMPKFAAEICDPDQAVGIAAAFARLDFGPMDRYENYEVFRDIKRVCDIHTTTPDPLATLVPPLWMLNHRLTFPLLAVLIVYGTTFLTHWAMFLIAYGLVSLYTRRAQTNLLRSYQMFSERFFWVVLAETDELRARATCRQFDADITFLADPAPKSRKKRRQGVAA